MSTKVVKLKKMINRFNKDFNKEEKRVIVLSSLVTLMAFVIGLIILCMAISKAFNWYIDLTAPHVINALNNIIGFFFEGWSL